jgi:hypothetical protein
MGLFQSHSDRAAQQAEKEQQLMAALRQAAAPYEPMVLAGLQRLTRWAFPEDQIERVDEAAGGYAWRLWHTRADGSRFVDVTAQVFFEDRRPDKPVLFLATLKTPGGTHYVAQGPLTPEDVDHVLRRCVASHE